MDQLDYVAGNFCPWCGSKRVDVTLMADRRKRFICTGQPCHEWLDGEGPEPEPPEESRLAGVFNKFRNIFRLRS